MSEAPPVLLLPDGSAAAEGAACDVPAEGLVLRLALPPGRRLAEAVLRLAAPPPVAAGIAPLAITSSLGAFPAAGKPRWVAVELPGERTVTGVLLTGDTTGAARLQVFSQGAWRPLTPPDTIAVTDGTPVPTRLTPVAASRIMAEMLAPFPAAPAAAGPAVLVPAPLAVTAIGVMGTDQPCHVAVAIGADPPFFTCPGPLPPAPVEVPGLLRAANRFLAETPGASAVPIRVTAAAAPARLLLATIRASLQPAPGSAPGGGGPTPPGPPPETPFPAMGEPEMRAAQLCGPTHWVAQRVEALPAGRAIASLALFLQAGAGAVSGSVALHPGGADRPEAAPLPGAEMPFSVPGGGAPGWVRCRPSAPVLPPGPVWAVCRIAAGEGLWFTAARRPPGLGAAVSCIPGDGWAPAPAAAGAGWAQLRLGLVEAAV